jgi:hypothetical protein
MSKKKKKKIYNGKTVATRKSFLREKVHHSTFVTFEYTTFFTGFERCTCFYINKMEENIFPKVSIRS